MKRWFIFSRIIILAGINGRMQPLQLLAETLCLPNFLNKWKQL